MSDADPDLKRTEGNQPVAIDVVDGQLIVERHSGRKETFSMGGGGLSLSDNGYLDVGYAATAQASGTTPSASTPLAYASYHDADNVLVASVDDNAALVAAGSDGVQLGPSYVAQHSGADSLWFTEGGLYFVVATAYAETGVEEIGLEVDFSGGGMSPVWQARGIQANKPQTAFILPVTPGSVAVSDPDPLSSGGTIVVSVWQNSGSPQDVSAELYVYKIA